MIQASKGADGKINKSESNRLALERAFEKLEQRFEKLERINYRILSINQVPDDQAGYQKLIDASFSLSNKSSDFTSKLYNNQKQHFLTRVNLMKYGILSSKYIIQNQ